MTALTLPRIAAELDHCAGPWYAALSTTQTAADEQLVIWMPEPYIPASMAGLYRWATDADRIGTEHITLDVYVVAQLLAHDLSVDPDGLTGEEAAAIIDRELARVGCDMYRCCLEIYAAEADDPNASQRWDRYVLAAGRLLEVSL